MAMQPEMQPRSRTMRIKGATNLPLHELSTSLIRSRKSDAPVLPVNSRRGRPTHLWRCAGLWQPLSPFRRQGHGGQRASLLSRSISLGTARSTWCETDDASLMGHMDLPKPELGASCPKISTTILYPNAYCALLHAPAMSRTDSKARRSSFRRMVTETGGYLHF